MKLSRRNAGLLVDPEDSLLHDDETPRVLLRRFGRELGLRWPPSERVPATPSPVPECVPAISSTGVREHSPPKVVRRMQRRPIVGPRNHGTFSVARSGSKSRFGVLLGGASGRICRPFLSLSSVPTRTLGSKNSHRGAEFLFPASFES